MSLIKEEELFNIDLSSEIKREPDDLDEQYQILENGNSFLQFKMSKRGENFSAREKELMTQLVIKYKDIVECKKTDAKSTHEKNKGWQLLTDELNAIGGFCRTPTQVKKAWSNLKQSVKKKEAQRKQSFFQMGKNRFKQDLWSNVEN